MLRKKRHYSAFLPFSPATFDKRNLQVQWNQHGKNDIVCPIVCLNHGVKIITLWFAKLRLTGDQRTFHRFQIRIYVRGARYVRDFDGRFIFCTIFHEDFKNIIFFKIGHTQSTHNFCPRSPRTCSATGYVGRACV